MGVIQTMGIPRSLMPMLETLPSEAQRSLLSDYRKRRKSLFFAYFAWLFLGWHYLYLRRVGLHFAFWLSLGGLLVWWFIDLFRVGAMVNRLNEDCARELLVAYRSIYSRAGQGMASPSEAPVYGSAENQPEDGEPSYTLVFILTVAGLAAIIGIAGFVYPLLFGPVVAPEEASNVVNSRAPQNIAASSERETSTVGAWMLKKSVDPMTDAESLSASRDYQGQAARIRVSVKCSNHKNLYYFFSAFDPENGSPVSMSSVPNPVMAAGMFKVTGGLVLVQSIINYAVRVDGQPSQNGRAINPKRDNQLILGGASKPLSSHELSKGAVLYVRLPIESGSEVVAVDQTDPNIAEILQACHAVQGFLDDGRDGGRQQGAADLPFVQGRSSDDPNSGAENLTDATSVANITS